MLKNTKKSSLRSEREQNFDDRLDMDVAKQRELIYKWLKSHKYAVLATSYKDKPWAATVDYSSDKNLNIYIHVNDESTKFKNLTKNPAVSLVIDSQSKEGTLQIQGEAKSLNIKKKTKTKVMIKPGFIIFRRLDKRGEVQMMILNLINPNTKYTIGDWYKTLLKGKRGE